jgi:hypothetical protein
MCRRRGSAIALKGSDVVQARGMTALYIPIWEYVKRLGGKALMPDAVGSGKRSSAEVTVFSTPATKSTKSTRTKH